MKSTLRFLGLRLAGADPKMHRLIRYWGATVLLYLLCIGIIWIEVLSGAADQLSALVITAVAVLGHLLFYVLIRLSNEFALTPSRLSEFQGRFAIICTIGAYTTLETLRQAVLLVLLVNLVFCAFTLESRRTHSLSLFAVVLLGLTMIGMVAFSPHEVNALTELKLFVLVSVMVAAVGFLTGRMSELRVALKAQKAELMEAVARIQELATQDELTMLPNRRHMASLLKAEEATRQDSKPACLAVLDLDLFKHVNDTYGHARGDEVLREFARQGRLVLRAKDVFARWGGEEFLLYLPDTNLGAAKAVIERLQEQVNKRRFTHCDTQFGITFSAGLAELRPGESVESGVNRADALLYAAKAKGRDRLVCTADDDS